MNDATIMQVRNRFARFVNFILIIMAFIENAGLIALNFSRSIYTEISNDIFSAEAPLMNSILLDMILRPVMSIVPIGLMVLLGIKETKIKSLYRRLFINAAVFAGMMIYLFMILFLLYSPVIK